MTDWLDRFFKFAGLDEPADLSKAPPEPPRPLTQEELRARMDAQYDEYKRSRAGQEARAAFALSAWRAGQTGYPLVDAGMRQLRGEAYKQVPGVKTSVVQGVGGMFAASGTVIFSNEAP